MLGENDSNLSQLNSYIVDQVAKLKEDIMVFSKFFYSSSELAQQYLKDQLSGNIDDLAKRHYNMVNQYKELQTKGATQAQILEFEQQVRQLSQELNKKEAEKKGYKLGPAAKQAFDDLNSLFQRFVKDMFRKFKKFLQTTQEFEGGDFPELDTHKDKLKDFVKNGINEYKSLMRDLPENMTQLASFPTVNSQAYNEVIKK